MMEIKTILMIDNYDSFTWNVYQEISKLLSRNSLVDFVVKRNDQISLLQAIEMRPEKLIISPGPGYPSSAGVSMEFIEHFAGKIPILGVCLGEQCMFELYGGKVVPCGELVHGKTTPVEHDGKGLFYGLDQNIECTR
jgi:anthranilate synthase/indole-3-glycerol phosphate synthase/phosphoribosylanthranilate isomerase